MPQPYPDELIGSVYIRAGRHRGLPTKSLSSVLFGSRRSHWPLLLSANLGQFSPAMGISSTELLRLHTVLPYATAFMAPEETIRLTKVVLGPEGRYLATLSHSATLGQSRIRYCDICVEADLERYGESYWHRSHNLPFVCDCPIHGTPLRQLSKGKQKRGCSVTLPPDESSGTPVTNLLPPTVSDILTQSSLGLLDTQARQTPRAWLQTYRKLAQRQGFPIQGSGFSNLSILTAMRDFYGSAFLQAFGLDFSTKGNPWPVTMLREGSNTCFVTAKHLLLQTFLQKASVPKLMPARQPGRRLRDYAVLDSATTKKLEKIIAAQPTGQRLTVSELLTRAGSWQVFRHHRGEMPKTAQAILTFKCSDLAERQAGRRPRKYCLKASMS